MICDYCKEEFIPHHGHQKRFCSGWCRVTWHKRQWEKKYPDKHSRHKMRTHYLTKYGLTPNDLERMYKEQNNKCKICMRESENTLHVDHNHETGEVRGLLCNNCNLALGLFKDDPLIIKSAMEYVS